MASINKVVLVGNLGADPELRFLPSGDPVANLSVATTDRRSDGKGGHMKVTEWHRVSLYGKQAEVAQKYLKKGSQVYVEGKLRASIWTDRSGLERKTWSVIADRMQMLGKPEIRTLDGGRNGEDEMSWMDSPVPNALGGDNQGHIGSAAPEDDIPF